MAAAFTLERVSPNPARFDLKKCTAINGDWIRALSAEDLASRVIPFLVRSNVLAEPLSDDQRHILMAAIPLIQERLDTLAQAVGMLSFLFVDEVQIESEVREAMDVSVVSAALAALEPVSPWSAADIEAALRAALIEGLGLKPKVAFTPVRIAVTGRRVSPPLFESMEILGRDISLARLRAAAG